MRRVRSRSNTAPFGRRTPYTPSAWSTIRVVAGLTCRRRRCSRSRWAEQVLEVNGDDHRGGNTTGIGHWGRRGASGRRPLPGRRAPVARAAVIGLRPFAPSVRSPCWCGARPRVRAPPAVWPRQCVSRKLPVQDPPRHLVEFDMPALPVELICGPAAVGIDPVDHLVGEHAQLGDRMDPGVPGQQPLTFIDVVGVKPRRSTCVTPVDDRDLLRAEPAGALCLREMRPDWSHGLPEHAGRLPDLSGGPHPPGGFTRGQSEHTHQHPDHPTAASTPPADSVLRRRRSMRGR